MPACPHDAIDVLGDPEDALALAERRDAVLILSVEAEVYFHPRAPEQVVNACYGLGFLGVERGILGDELVAEEYRALFENGDWGTLIRSTCPVVVERIKAEYPELVPYLAPVKTPLAAEAEYLRGIYGQDAPLVYAGVCVAEADEHVEAVVTFEELAGLFAAKGIDVGTQPRWFERIPSERRRYQSTPGGLPLPVLSAHAQTSRRFRTFRGLERLDAIARAVTVDGVDLGFVDILPCEGCLDHPLLGPRAELFRRRRIAADQEPPRAPHPVVDRAVPVRVEAAFEFEINGRPADAGQIGGVIQTIGTAPDGSHWNCGACGYRTCNRFAQSYLRGRATLRQCPPYQERRAHEAQLQAAVDELTGLWTYRVLRDRLRQEMARSDRSAEPFGVVFIDLDRFKPVNDAFGHEAGNRVLAAVGRKLQRAVRQTDIAARYGGDEFVVLVVRTDLDGSKRVGEVMREAVYAVGLDEGFAQGIVTASVGVAAYDPGAARRADPLEAADAALYRAKSAGGDRVEGAE